MVCLVVHCIARLQLDYESLSELQHVAQSINTGTLSTQ